MSVSRRIRSALDYKSVTAAAFLLLVVLIFYIVVNSLAQRDAAIDQAKRSNDRVASLSQSVQELHTQIGVFLQQLHRAGIKPRIIIKSTPGPRPSSSACCAAGPTTPPQPQFSPTPGHRPSHHPSPQPSHHPSPRPSPSRSPTPSPSPSPKICVPLTKICLVRFVLWLWW